MVSEGRGVSERERLVELSARCAALAEVDERLAQARAGEGFAADRADLAAECCGFETSRSESLSRPPATSTMISSPSSLA